MVNYTEILVQFDMSLMSYIHYCINHSNNNIPSGVTNKDTFIPNVSAILPSPSRKYGDNWKQITL